MTRACISIVEVFKFVEKFHETRTYTLKFFSNMHKHNKDDYRYLDLPSCIRNSYSLGYTLRYLRPIHHLFLSIDPSAISETVYEVHTRILLINKILSFNKQRF